MGLDNFPLIIDRITYFTKKQLPERLRYDRTITYTCIVDYVHT